MRLIDDFRDADSIRSLLQNVNEMSEGRQMSFMEVCGTHTMAISRFGLRNSLAKNIRLLSGPGCPVCVTPDRDLTAAIKLSETEGVIFTSFGDMLRVPTGTGDSLAKARSRGASIEIVYSTLDALRIARENPDKKVVFFAVGFETTAPTIAAALKIATDQNLQNFFIYSVLKLVPPAMIALLEAKEVAVDGFILPGHVSTILGSKTYEIISDVYGIPCSIAGFEPADILLGIRELIGQVIADESFVGIEYKRVVKPQGNKHAIDLLYEFFEIDGPAWRGLGVIPDSGLKLRPEYSHFDIRNAVDLQISDSELREVPGCMCGDILSGRALPTDCKLFGKACSEENPIGPCMVSREGTCSAYFKYDQAISL